MQTDSLTDSFSAVVETISATKSRFRREFALAAGAMVAAYFWMINARVDDIVMFALPVIGLLGVAAMQERRYTKHSTNLIMPLLCDAIDGISYNGFQWPGISEREKELLLPKGNYRSRSISISGGFGDQWFRQNNVVLQSKSGKSKKTTFHGVLLELPALGIAPPLLVRPSSQGRGTLTSWVFGSNDPMPAQTSLGTLSQFGESLTLFAPDKATLDDYAPRLASLIKQSDAVFTDSATIDAVLITQNSTFIAIADGSLPFSTGGIFQRKTALARDIERASRELAVPIKLMQLWSESFRDKSNSAKLT